MTRQRIVVDAIAVPDAPPAPATHYRVCPLTGCRGCRGRGWGWCRRRCRRWGACSGDPEDLTDIDCLAGRESVMTR